MQSLNKRLRTLWLQSLINLAMLDLKWDWILKNHPCLSLCCFKTFFILCCVAGAVITKSREKKASFHHYYMVTTRLQAWTVRCPSDSRTPLSRLHQKLQLMQSSLKFPPVRFSSSISPSIFSLTYLLQGLWEAQIDLRLSLCGQPHRKCLCNGFYMSAVKADEDPALSAASVNTVSTRPSRKRSAPF